MASEYKMYLAANVLNEDRVVTYRLLSRALKVNVNVAKEMLFEFHRQQNGKKPGTIHATYLVAGTKRKVEPIVVKNGNAKDDEDNYMQSSPFQSSPVARVEENVEEAPVLSVTLVKEEDMDELRSQYETISSIHVYSLGPSPLKDLQILSDSARYIRETYAIEDPLGNPSLYGTISNKGVRRRTGRRPPPSSSSTIIPAPIKSTSTSSKTTDSKKESVKPSAAEEELPPSQPAKSSQSTAKDFFGKASNIKKASSNSAPATKKDPSNIFKAFAKGAPKLKREGTGSSAASGKESTAPSGLEDEPMKDVSEDEEDDYVPPPQPTAKNLVDSDRKSRKEREAALKKMMEDEDEEDDEKGKLVVDAPEPEKADTAVVLEPKETVEVSGGRRRGRRRVMKKRTMKDEEGYLVTKEEAEWESFSEEEPLVSKSKTATPTSSNAGKAKKGASKPGQGNIMSFFGKK